MIEVRSQLSSPGACPLGTDLTRLKFAAPPHASRGDEVSGMVLEVTFSFQVPLTTEG